jgi:hypothetical protein
VADAQSVHRCRSDTRTPQPSKVVHLAFVIPDHLHLDPGSSELLRSSCFILLKPADEHLKRRDRGALSVLTFFPGSLAPDPARPASVESDGGANFC